MLCAGIFTILLPVIPIIHDKISPLNESRPPVFAWNGDYLIDSNNHVLLITIIDTYNVFVVAGVLCALDPLYAAIGEHAVALYAIVK